MEEEIEELTEVQQKIDDAKSKLAIVYTLHTLYKFPLRSNLYRM